MSAPYTQAMARPLAALARLLDYPSAELQTHADELIHVLAAVEGLRAEERQAVVSFIQELAAADLMEAQAEYVELFDRGRKVSLHVFEHVYGESRDRGPAMIELLRVYREHGFELGTSELPDYLPVLLEFCARLSPEAAHDWLVETRHVLQRVQVRLAERSSGYASLFVVLLRLIGAEVSPEALSEMAGIESRDDTPAALDEVWAEAPVTFGGQAPTTNCGASQQAPRDELHLIQGG